MSKQIFSKLGDANEARLSQIVQYLTGRCYSCCQHLFWPALPFCEMTYEIGKPESHRRTGNAGYQRLDSCPGHCSFIVVLYQYLPQINLSSNRAFLGTHMSILGMALKCGRPYSSKPSDHQRRFLLSSSMYRCQHVQSCV